MWSLRCSSWIILYFWGEIYCNSDSKEDWQLPWMLSIFNKLFGNGFITIARLICRNNCFFEDHCLCLSLLASCLHTEQQTAKKHAFMMGWSEGVLSIALQTNMELKDFKWSLFSTQTDLRFQYHIVDGRSGETCQTTETICVCSLLTPDCCFSSLSAELQRQLFSPKHTAALIRYKQKCLDT